MNQVADNGLVPESLLFINNHIESSVADCIKWILCENVDDKNRKKFSKLKDYCEAILDWCWERINCGKWSEVSIELRQVYAYHQLLKAIYQLLEYFNSNEISLIDSLYNALDSIDHGLIMSPDFEKNTLKNIASNLNQVITLLLTSKVENDSDLKQKWNKITKKVSHKINEWNQSNVTVPYLKISGHNRMINKVELLDFIEFENEYFRSKTPIIITKATVNWPCMSCRKWSIQYLLEKASFRLVPIEIGSKYTDELWSQKIMALFDFIDMYILSSENGVGYLAQHNLFEQICDLSKDFLIPDYCATSDSDSTSISNVDINAWFGPSDTISPLHTDPKHNMFVQVMGSKYIRLYSDQTPAEQIFPYEENLLSNTSKVDLENINGELYNNFNQIDPTLIYECILNEGEMLYIPKQYWHYVKSLSVSFSLSFWWS